MSRLLHFLHQAWTPPTDPTTSFTGKTIIVTGANSGLGFEAALKLLQLNASLVILAVRDVQRGEKSKEEILRRVVEEGRGTGVNENGREIGERVQGWECDMSDYGSVVAFVERVEKLERVDGVVLNAGIFGVGFRVREGGYGWEEVLQVNVLSTALLGILLLPILRASEKKSGDGLPVLEFVSSDGHENVTIPPERREADNLLKTYNTAEGYNPRVQYQTSKLFVMYVMQTLASLAKSPDGKIEVLVTSVCPGGAKSNLSRGYEGIVASAFKFVFSSLFLRTTEQGARTLVSGLGLGEEGHGRFWQSDIIKEPASLVSGEEGEELRKRVWSEIVEVLEKDVPKVKEVLHALTN